MKAKLIYILSLILLLIIYSSEIFFMPNYLERGDMWHLFEWILFFSISFGFVLILNLVFMFKQRKANPKVLLILFLTIISFASLNNPKFNFKEFGYVGVILILIYYLAYQSWIKCIKYRQK